MSEITLLQGDCLKLLKNIPDGSVDMVLCDLPYGTTKNKWDSVIPIYKLWDEWKRVTKKKCSVVLFSQMPFTAMLVNSNMCWFKHEWIWEKPKSTGFLNSNFAPLKCHENILVFSPNAACYVKDEINAITYNPQMLTGKPYVTKGGHASTNYDCKWNRETTTICDGKRYPRDVITFSHDKKKHHPTQKPVPLLEYLIRTYTDPGMTVLDNCMGSGSIGVACINTGRNFIGMELDPGYFKIAKQRIEEAERNLSGPAV